MWVKATSSLPPVGVEVLVAVVYQLDRVYAVAAVAESQRGDFYWESGDESLHGLSCDDEAAYWMEFPRLHSIDGKTSQG